MSEFKAKIKNLIEAEGKELVKMLIVSAVVTLAFLIYLYFAGIPMTKARNIYNEGVEYYERGEKKQALQKFEEAQRIWKTDATEEYIDILKKDLN